MALIDSVMKMVTKDPRPNPYENGKGPSRSEREAKIKDKAGLVINVFAALLAFNVWYGSGLSSKVMNNTIKANDIWVFYQAKSIKQTLAENAAEDAAARGDHIRAAQMRAKVDRYENEPEEGKRALFAQAKALEAERDHAKLKSPWIGYAGTAYQLAIVLLSASILAVSMSLFWGSFAVAGFGLLLMSQGIWLWLPI